MQMRLYKADIAFNHRDVLNTLRYFSDDFERFRLQVWIPIS